MGDLFPAPKTAFVFNEAMAPPDREPIAVFQKTRAVLGAPELREVVSRATMVRLPRLRNMKEVEEGDDLKVTGAYFVRAWERKVAQEMKPIMDWLV